MNNNKASPSRVRFCPEVKQVIDSWRNKHGVSFAEAVSELVMRGAAVSESQDRVLEARSKETAYMSVLSVLLLKEIAQDTKIFDCIEFDELKIKAKNIGLKMGFEIDPELIRNTLREES